MPKRKLLLVLFTIIYFFSNSVIPAFAAITYSYDSNGNMTSDGTNCYTYNEANQVKQVKNCSNNQLIAEYVYDYQGNRIAKKVYENGTLKQTVYSPSDEYETKKLATGSAENTSYYFANQELIAKKNPDGTKQYYQNDHLNSNSLLTDQQGTKVEETTYDPWGEVKTGGTKSKYQYTGQEKDQETSLNYYNARYYDPHLRHFTQPDDVINNVYNPQELNRYAYVKNNPLKYTDPTGHFAILLAIGISAAIGGVAGFAEVRMNNPNAGLKEYAKGIGVGIAAGAVAGVASIATASLATAALASTALAETAFGSAAISTIANVAAGGYGGIVQNGISNVFDGKKVFENGLQAGIIGGLTGGLAGNLGESLVPRGVGRSAEKITFSLSLKKLGTNALAELQKHSLTEGLSTLVSIPLNKTKQNNILLNNNFLNSGNNLLNSKLRLH